MNCTCGGTAPGFPQHEPYCDPASRWDVDQGSERGYDPYAGDLIEDVPVDPFEYPEEL